MQIQKVILAAPVLIHTCTLRRFGGHAEPSCTLQAVQDLLAELKDINEHQQTSSAELLQVATVQEKQESSVGASLL